jgi:hypothetical protein
MLQRIRHAARERLHLRLLATTVLNKSSQTTHLQTFPQARDQDAVHKKP